MERENELVDEPVEVKNEEDTGVVSDMSKEVDEAKSHPPEEGV